MDPRLLLEAADRAALGVVVAQLTPPKIVHASAAAAELFGVSPQDLQDRDPFELVAPEQRDLLRDRLRRRLAGELLPPVTFTIVRGTGARLKVDCRIADFARDGQRLAVIYMSESLRSADLVADARYRALVDAAPDGVAITRAGRFLYANRAALALLGCGSFAEVADRSMAEFLLPEDMRVMIERTTAMVRDGVRFPPRDYRVAGRDTVAEVSSVVIDFEGAPAVLAFVRDVTEARKLQAELERTQRLTSLGTLLAGMAHEVNNPLAFAKLGAELLQRFLDTGCDDVEGGRSALASVVSGLDRIAALVRELRAFVGSGEATSRPQPLDDIVASALRMTGPVIRPRARLDVELGPLPMIHSNARRLEQVFVNVLINAAQAFESADVTRNVVRVRARRVADRIELAIEDNGRGIDPVHLPRVFDPFFTTKPAGEGIGLGLSISHAIATQHGGRIDVASAAGRGTTVTVTLPVEDRIAAAPAPSAPAAAVVRRARILVVDDEVAIGGILHDLLDGHDVTFVTGGLAARALLLDPAVGFDLVLCDLAMPDLSGAALFEQVRAQRPALAQRFVLMTGGAFGDVAITHADGTAVRRLEKPFTLVELTAVVEAVAGS